MVSQSKLKHHPTSLKCPDHSKRSLGAESTPPANAAREGDRSFTELLKVRNTSTPTKYPFEYLECSCYWNACNGDDCTLRAHAKYPMPDGVAQELKRWAVVMD